MSHNPVISVITPVHNGAKFLPQCLEDLRTQTLQDIEIILIDDGSTDDTAEICKKSAENDPRVVLILQNNQGAGAARNAGLKQAKGQYISFLDVDDLHADKTALEKLYRAAQQHNADICGGNVVGLQGEKIIPQFAPHTIVKKNEFFGGNYIPTEDRLFSRFIFKKIFLDENAITFPDYQRGQDSVFLLSCFSKKPNVQMISDFVHVSRIEPNTRAWTNRTALDWMAHYRDALNLSYQNGWHDIALRKVLLLQAQWPEINEIATAHNADISDLTTEINNIVDWKTITHRKGALSTPLIAGNAILPAFDKNNIPIIMASDNNFLRYLSVTLQSLLDNASPDNNYDIIVLSSNPHADSTRRLLDMITPYPNFSLRFFDVENMVRHYGAEQFKITFHFSVATYYRFFIPIICKTFDKVAYIDCDLVVNRDIAQFYKHDIGDNYIAGVPDSWWISNYNTGNVKNYSDNVLKIKDPARYFNAGVTLLNVKKMIADNILEKLFQRLNEVGTPMLVDQDIINSVCQDKSILLERNWNVTAHMLDRNLIGQIPHDVYTKLIEAANDPYIVHYTSKEKPWSSTHTQMGDYFWRYAVKTPFYEEILNLERYKTIAMLNRQQQQGNAA